MSKRSYTTLFFASVTSVGILGALYYFLTLESEKRVLTNHHPGSSTPAVVKERVVPRRSLKVKKDHIIEICLSDLQSVREALSGGCESIELCVNRLEGGVTPSIGLIEQAVTVIGGKDVALHVLIRPRPGGFHYSNDEFDIVQRDILAAKMAGADGIVFGALDKEGKVDIPRMKLVRELSKGLLLTFHRAFDVCTEPHHIVLEQIIALGCDRLLTSGGAQSNVLLNLQALAAIQTQAAGRIEVVAAAGVTAGNVQQIIRDAGVRSVHAGSAVTTKISSSTTGDKAYGNKVEKKADSVPVSPKDGFNESYVDVQVDRSDSDDRRTSTSPASTKATRSPASAAGAAAIASPVDELLSWSCVCEDLVHELVTAANIAFAGRVTISSATTINKMDESETYTGKDYSAGVLEGSYIHL